MKDFQNRYSQMFRDSTREPDQCPSAESLADLAAGRTWPWQRRRLVEHLGDCSHCADDYRVLTTARGGVLAALENHGYSGEGLAIQWMRPALVATAAMGVAALGIAVVLQTGGSNPASDHAVLFASQFEPSQRQAEHAPGHDRLFTSDFGEPDGESAQLFRDDFGG